MLFRSNPPLWHSCFSHSIGNVDEVDKGSKGQLESMKPRGLSGSEVAPTGKCYRERGSSIRRDSESTNWSGERENRDGDTEHARPILSRRSAQGRTLMLRLRFTLACLGVELG